MLMEHNERRLFSHGNRKRRAGWSVSVRTLNREIRRQNEEEEIMIKGSEKERAARGTRNEVSLTMEPMKAVLLAFYIIYLRVHSSSDIRLKLCSARVVFRLRQEPLCKLYQAKEPLTRIGRKFASACQICDSSTPPFRWSGVIPIASVISRVISRDIQRCIVLIPILASCNTNWTHG